jgi:heterodisulfide reductase subunit A-like polyferredoxin
MQSEWLKFKSTQIQKGDFQMSYQILANGNVIAPSRELKNAGEYDVIVCGGGMAGFGSAIAAARHGAKVLIIDKATALGGLATVGLVPIPLDIPTGISQEMLTRLEEVDGHTRRNSDPEKHKLILSPKDTNPTRGGCLSSSD